MTFCNYFGPHKSTLQRIDLRVCESDLKWFYFSCIKVHLQLMYTTSIQP